MANIIEASNITKSFSNHVALNDVSFKIPKGKIYGLLGPNGAGKTTFIRLINQISKPDQGEILFNGEPLSENHIAKIGYLPEERGLYPKMKVGEQAMYLAQLKGMSKQDAKTQLMQWFEKFEITKWWNNRVEDLSKGMAQKIQFIVTIVHQPELLILDEPFSGFDPINTELIKQEILELKKNGTSIIYSTHNMQSVEEICDAISLVNKGEVILKGTMNRIRKKYSSDQYEIHFLGNMISFTNALWTSFELVAKKEVKPGEFIVRVAPVENASINQLIVAVAQYCTIKSVNETSAKMYDVFINAVEKANSEADKELSNA